MHDVGDDLRWLSRYQLLREVWRGQDRFVVDPALERLLCSDRWERLCRRHPVVAGLVDELLPVHPGADSVQLVVCDATRLRELAARRGGVTCVALDDGAAAALDASWAVALVELAGFVGVPRTAGSTTRMRVDPRLQTMVAVLAQRAQRVVESARAPTDQRTVVLSAPSDATDQAAATVDDFVELVGTYFDDASVYGMSSPAVVSAFRFVEAFGDDDSPTSADDVSVEYDSLLADAEPELFALVAVSDASRLSDGLTLMELPIDSSGGPTGGSTSSSGVITPTSSHPALGPEESRLRLDRALAQQQAAKWQVERLEEELRRMLARPVGDEEAEAAVARARAPAAGDALEPAPDEDGHGARRQVPNGVAAPRERRGAAARLATLVRQIERGEVSPATLRRRLVQVRRLLARGTPRRSGR